MNVNEFLARLEQLLTELPPEERSAALEYYTEYLQDAAPEEGVDVTGLLGTPEAVAADIRLNRVAEGSWSAGYTGNPGGASFGECIDGHPGEGAAAPAAPGVPGEAAEKPSASFGAQSAAFPQDAQSSPAQPRETVVGFSPENAAGGVQPGTAAAGLPDADATRKEAADAKPRRSGAWLPWVLLAVFTSPFWLWLVVLLLAVAFSAVAVVAAVVVAAVVLVVAAVVMLVAAAPLLGTAFGTSILLVGVALLMAAVGLIVLGGFFWLVSGLLPLLIAVLRRFFQWLKGRVRL